MCQIVRQLRRKRKPGARAVDCARMPHRLHAMLTSGGVEEQRDPGYDWHGTKRGKAEFVLFQYTLAGQGMLRYETQRHVVQPGQAMCLHFPYDNRYWLPPNGRWRFFWVCMNGEQVVRAWRAAVAKLGPVLTLDEDAPPVTCAAQIVSDILAGNIRSAWHASSLAYQLAMQLMELAQPTDFAQRRTPRQPAIQRAIDFVTEHYHQPINTEDIAKASGYSRFHFSRLFSQSEGVSPGEYLMHHRMRMAINLLETTDLPIKTIARQCGYTSANYFTKAFAKAMGAPPASFRNSGMFRGS